ncbi:hypothetical protein ABPG75_007473 [Micractinium tetrahymenae]
MAPAAAEALCPSPVPPTAQQLTTPDVIDLVGSDPDDDDDVQLVSCSSGCSWGQAGTGSSSAARAGSGGSSDQTLLEEQERSMQAALLASFGVPQGREAGPSGSATGSGSGGCSSGSTAGHRRIPGAAMEWPLGLMPCHGTTHTPTQGEQDWLALPLSQVACHGDARILSAVSTHFCVSLRQLLRAAPDLRTCGSLTTLSETPRRQLQEEAARMRLQGEPLPRRLLLCNPRLEKPALLYGKHHTEMFLLEYQHGLRVCVYTEDMPGPSHLTLSIQGIWYQDFPRLENVAVGPGGAVPPPASGFGATLYAYMQASLTNTPHKEAWRILNMIAWHDYSMARAALIASVPGRHRGKQGFHELAGSAANHASVAAPLTGAEFPLPGPAQVGPPGGARCARRSTSRRASGARGC